MVPVGKWLRWGNGSAREIVPLGKWFRLGYGSAREIVPLGKWFRYSQFPSSFFYRCRVISRDVSSLVKLTFKKGTVCPRGLHGY
jgi:hypothetical protein